ncbi:hypothetical protein L195_g056867, partial [Trifolium pratense]
MGEEDDHGWNTVKGRQSLRRGNNVYFKFDIATASNFNKDNTKSLTTFFFTDFPESFRAKALFNTFHHYGDIKEVVIPAKRDKGGRKFGFARFDQVKEPRQLECELDNIIIGRDKISVNLSRFQRREEHKRSDDMGVERTGMGGNLNLKLNRSLHTSMNVDHHHNHVREAEKNTYAQAVRTGEVLHQGRRQHIIALSYEADENDLLRLQKAFI